MIITACADRESARVIARMLVERRLAACVQALPVESTYVWKDQICVENEITLLIKSKTALFDEVAAAIKENHSYEVPEIIQCPITNGYSEYLRWIDENIWGGITS